MADPTKYGRDYGFANYQATNPATPLPGNKVDTEFDNVAASLGETIDALGDIRRSDGALANGIVTEESFSADALDVFNDLVDAATAQATAAGVSAGTAATQAGISTTKAGEAAASAVTAAAAAASVTLPIPIASGGTGQITAAAALTALGAGALATANAWLGVQSMSDRIAVTYGTVGGLSAISATTSEDSATLGPQIRMSRVSTTPAANDQGGTLEWAMSDSALNQDTMGRIMGVLDDPTSTSEDFHFEHQARIAGAFATQFNVGNGVWGQGATGGAKGAGSSNWTACYDDNVLLTCYILAAYLDGKIDLATWDGYVTNRIIPAVLEKRITKAAIVEDVIEAVRTPEGKPVFDMVQQEDGSVVPEQRRQKTGERVIEPAEFEMVELEPEREIKRLHEPARRFSAERMDEIDPAVYIAKWKATGVLPGFPSPAEWAANGPLSTGDIIQRLWETVELLVVHNAQILDRLAALEARLP